VIDYLRRDRSAIGRSDLLVTAGRPLTGARCIPGDGRLDPPDLGEYTGIEAERHKEGMMTPGGDQESRNPETDEGEVYIEYVRLDEIHRDP
jgi:hypothetical protein